MAFKDNMRLGDGVRIHMDADVPKPKKKPQHASFQEWKKKPHAFETTPEFRRNACSLCNLPAQHPIHLDY